MRLLLYIAIAIVGAYVAYNLAYPTYSHRYRLTLEFEAEGQVHSGSSVVEVSARQQPKVLPELGAIIRARGEATLVDLGKHGSIVALLARGQYGEDIDAPTTLALRAFKVPRQSGLESFRAIQRLNGKQELLTGDIPTLLAFADRSSMDTATIVAPKDLETVRGVKLLRATVELTKDNVTHGQFEKMPWLDDLRSRRLQIRKPNTFSPAEFQFIRG